MSSIKIPDELKDTATSLSLCTLKKISAAEVGSELIRNLGKEYSVSEYKSYIDFFGEKITLITPQGQREAVALDVTEGGLLKVREDDGGISLISAAEVSLRNRWKEY